MKKVSLLGDSIRLFGYGPRVPALLGEDVTVFQPQENCKFAKFTLRGLYDWKAELETSDVIHFNCGIWDAGDVVGDGLLFSSDEEYVENILRIARRLLQFTPKVIFATTTPVHPSYVSVDNADVDRFNALVVHKLQALGVRINDLHALIAEDVEGNICEDRLHLSELGAQRAAERVAEVIRAYLSE